MTQMFLSLLLLHELRISREAQRMSSSWILMEKQKFPPKIPIYKFPTVGIPMYTQLLGGE